MRNNPVAKRARIVLFSFFVPFFLPREAAAQVPEGNSCIACHRDVWEEASKSIHSRQGIFCQSCHGGDPLQTDKALAKASGTGYVGIPNKKQIAEICGRCHADVEKMNFYGIPTDQLARYKTSTHGKALFEKGDERVAVCSDCHGNHDVLPISDPASSVYPSNLPRTCNRCHGKENLMKRYNLPSDIFETYKKSVHGIAVLEKKDLGAAHCASCHGSHGAVPPGVKEIGATCGKCHVNEKKYFLESTHASSKGGGKFSECVSCHGFHGVRHPSLDLYKEICVQCHAAGSSTANQGEAIRRLLEQSSRDLEDSINLTKRVAVEGLFVEEETAALEEAKTLMIGAAPLQHTLSLDRISEVHRKIIGITGAVKQKIGQKRRVLKLRKMILVPIWIFILVMAVSLWLKYRQLEKRKREENGGGPYEQ